MNQEPLRLANDYFAFLGRKISQQEIQSMLPFFDCEEPGHGGNCLDQVCLNADCRFKGLCCVRCQYQKHRLHPQQVYPLHTFVSQLIEQLSRKNLILEESKRKCQQYRDMIISILKDYVNGIIDHLSIIVAQLHKYYTIFENSYENTLVKSHLIVHSLVYKKHIPQDKFQKYVREGVKGIAFEIKPPPKDFYAMNAYKPIALDERFKSDNGQIIINDQEKAHEMAQEFIEEMHKVAKDLNLYLKQAQNQIYQDVQLSKLSQRIPKFDSSALDLQTVKKQFGVNVENLFR